MDQMKLTYFNARGRAELTRLLFAQAGRVYVDHRMEDGEWKKLKPSTPKGEVPILEVGGKVICESGAIARFVARETGLYGKNNCEAAVCDMLLESFGEVVDAVIGKMMRAKTEEEKAAAEERLNKSLESLDKLTKQLKKGPFILGENASLADVSAYASVEFYKTANPDYKCEDGCSALKEIAKNFSSQPHIAEYIKSRPETKF